MTRKLKKLRVSLGGDGRLRKANGRFVKHKKPKTTTPEGDPASIALEAARAFVLPHHLKK